MNFWSRKPSLWILRRKLELIFDRRWLYSRLRLYFFREKTMPTTKRESLIFTLIMCFFMVLTMSIYNIWLQTWEWGWSTLWKALLGLPIGYVVAFILDWFLVAKIAKGVAFKYILKPEDHQLKVIFVVSLCMVVPMVILMSGYGSIQTSIQTWNWSQFFDFWMKSIPMNFILALPYQILISGPIVRTLFQRIVKQERKEQQ